MREYICFVEQFLSNRIKNNFYDKQSCIQNHIVLKDLLDCGRNFPQQKKKLHFIKILKKYLSTVISPYISVNFRFYSKFELNFEHRFMDKSPSVSNQD